MTIQFLIKSDPKIKAPQKQGEKEKERTSYQPCVVRSLYRFLLVIRCDSVGLFAQLVVQTVELSE